MLEETPNGKRRCNGSSQFREAVGDDSNGVLQTGEGPLPSSERTPRHHPPGGGKNPGLPGRLHVGRIEGDDRTPNWERCPDPACPGRRSEVAPRLRRGLVLQAAATDDEREHAKRTDLRRLA